MEQFLQVLEAITKYGGMVIMAGLFVVYLYLDRKDRKEREEREQQERKEREQRELEEKKTEHEAMTKVLSELSVSNRNIAESLNILKSSVDNQNSEFKQHDERAIKNFADIKQDLTILKERGK